MGLGLARLNSKHGPRHSLALFTTSLWLTLSLCLAAEDWPQFRGPGGQGHAGSTVAPMRWSESQNVRWKVPVPGTGWSSPVVAHGRTWLTTAMRERSGGRGAPISLRLLAYDVASGREVVNVEVFRLGSAPSINIKNSMASPTPVVDGETAIDASVFIRSNSHLYRIEE